MLHCVLRSLWRRVDKRRSSKKSNPIPCAELVSKSANGVARRPLSGHLNGEVSAQAKGDGQSTRSDVASVLLPLQRVFVKTRRGSSSCLTLLLHHTRYSIVGVVIEMSPASLDVFPAHC